MAEEGGCEGCHGGGVRECFGFSGGATTRGAVVGALERTRGGRGFIRLDSCARVCNKIITIEKYFFLLAALLLSLSLSLSASQATKTMKSTAKSSSTEKTFIASHLFDEMVL